MTNKEKQEAIRNLKAGIMGAKRAGDTEHVNELEARLKDFEKMS